MSKSQTVVELKALIKSYDSCAVVSGLTKDQLVRKAQYLRRSKAVCRRRTKPLAKRGGRVLMR